METPKWIQEFEREMLRRKHILLYGNIHDQYLWNNTYQSMYELLQGYLRDRGYNLIIHYDPIDGFSFDSDEKALGNHKMEPLPDDTDKRELFAALKRRAVVERNPDMLDNSGTSDVIPVVPTAPVDPLTPPSRGIPGAAAAPPQGSSVPLEDAFGDIRGIMAQNQTSVAAIVNVADMLTTDPNHFDLKERDALMLLKKATLEAKILGTGYRNTLIMLASELNRVPEWFHRDNPYVSLVQVDRPGKAERRQFAMHSTIPSGTHNGFYGGREISREKSSPSESSELEQVADEFADLTEGFQTIDLDALRVTSFTAKIPIRRKHIRSLVDYFKFGIKEDPWEKLNPARVKAAREELSKDVIGQGHAVDAAVTMLTTARVGLHLASGNQSGAPKGVFFFVGPTGVGKTELAKSLTKLVFGDEHAFARFDMSEYKEEHAAEKLAGAPPGFVGYEAGGQLTNHVMRQPHSILLFDEIEKAHPKVLDKFLQILEDGRLTDGKGQTAYFNQTAIIFTSNIGASDISDDRGQIIREGIMRRVQEHGESEFSYRDVTRHFEDEVKWYFTSRIGRAELLNRLGDNIVVFDMLRPEYVRLICEKFTHLFAESAREKYQVELQFQPSWAEFMQVQMAQADNMLMGGRRIKTLTITHLVNGINEWIFTNYPDTSELSGKTLKIDIANDGKLEVVDV